MKLSQAQKAPSKPYLTDTYQALDQNLWQKVLQVARGDLRYFTRVGPNGPRTIHAPNHGRGFRHWPNQRAVSWAIMQYNGYGGRWKGKDEKMASSSSPSGWIGFTVPSDTAHLLSQISVPGIREDKGSLHTTLIYMGDTSLDEFCKAISVAYDVVSQASPFSLSTSEVVSFDKGDNGIPVVCKVDSKPLHDFHASMCESLDAADVNYSKKWPTYKPHVCLAYAEDPVNFQVPAIAWGAHSLTMWLGHNGALASVTLPIRAFNGKIAIGDGRTLRSLNGTLSIFRTLWRYQTCRVW